MCLFLPGCASAMLLVPLASGISGAVSGYTTWKDGEASKYYAYDSEIVKHTVLLTIRDLNTLTITDQGADKEGDYTIRAVGSRHRDKFDIKIKKIENNITLLSIRINTMGNKDFADFIFLQVDNNIDLIKFK